MKTVSLDQLRQTFTPEYLQELASFGAVSEKTIMLLFKRGRIIQLEPKEELYQQGAQVRGFYVVLSGKILLFHHHLGKPALTRSYTQGEQIGFVGMIALHDRKGTAVAEQASLLLEVPVDDFFQLHESAPQDFGLLMLNLAREMARSIGQMGDRIAELEAQ
jgi:CRP-like cAMP-binding protein